MKFRTKLLVIYFVVLIVATTLVASIGIYTIYVNNKKETERFRADEVTKIKQGLKNYVDIAFENIVSNHKKAQSMDYLQKNYGQRLVDVIDLANSLIEAGLKSVQNGIMSEPDAKKLAMNAIRDMRYDFGTGYIWINDTGKPYPKMVMHPTVPALDGKILDDPKYNCALGKKENLFVAFRDVCEKDGEGFVDYLWPKPTKDGLTKDQQKLSYVRLIKEWNWIIGTGIYVDDAVKDAMEISKLEISKMRYDNGVGYFWINDTEKPYPKMVMHPTVPALDGKFLDDAKYNCALGIGKNLFSAFVDVCEKEGEGFVDYLWPKPAKDGLTKDQPKLSYVRLYKDWNWIVGTGVYIDDIDRSVAAKKAALNEQIKQLITTVSIVVAVIVIIAISTVAVLISRSIIKPLNNIIDGLFNISEEMTLASGKVLDSSQELAEGTTRQVSDIERSSSSIENMSEMTKQNAGYARDANSHMAETYRVVDESNISINKLIGSMEKISKSSEETKHIIKTIDDIAFQTNLLALNAAVEAARAGESGAGFAVVADEVRNLAMRAAEAARNTEDLINISMNEIKNGSALAEKSNEAFTRVASSTKQIGELIDKIADASREQSEGIEELLNAVKGMENITRQNSDTAEKSASASDELNNLSEDLKNFVDEMIGLVGGAKS